jgi:signal transduction histidine kinase
MLRLSLPDRLAAGAFHGRSSRPDVSTPPALATVWRAEHLLRDTARELEVATARARRSMDRLLSMALQPGSATPPRIDLMARVVELRSAKVQRLLTTIDDLAAIRTDRFELECKRVNLVPLLARTVSSMRTPKYPLQFGAPQGLTIFGDSERLTAAVRTMIEHAQHRNPRGCWIDIDLRRPLTGLAQIEVRDYGRPLSDAERDQLPDGQTPDRAWYLCAKVVEQHGGILELECLEEGGLRVNATLPNNGRHST